MPLVPQCVKVPNSEEITHLLPGEGDMDKRLFFILRPHQLITYDKTSREHSFTECWSETQEGGNNRHSDTAGGKSKVAYQRDWYIHRCKC